VVRNALDLHTFRKYIYFRKTPEALIKIITFLLLVVLLFLTACGQVAKTVQPVTLPPPTAKPVETNAVPTPTAQPSGVTLTYEDSAQVELVTPAGRHVYFDVTNPALFIAQPTANDIVLTTHGHGDHYYKPFVDAFPGQKLTFQTGKIELPDVTILSIAAGHNEGDPFLPSGGTDYIFVVDSGGIRFANFGDIGQNALTTDQLATLGKVDIAFMQFDNQFSMMNADNMKGFNLMDQVKPRLIIPSAHVSMPTMKIAFGRWTGYYTESRTIPFTRAIIDSLPAGTCILPLGNLSAAYGSIYNLSPWK
jgi:L-ascorbate metabolism protein UlaG (beta-lactamase superfamily)